MERERLTITLRKDVLKLVDQSIDGAKLRNRSHAIEYYLSQALSAKTLRTVLFLSGGARVRASYQAEGMGMGVRAAVNEALDVKSILQSLVSQGFTEVLLAGADATGLQATVLDAEAAGLNVKTIALESPDVTDVELEKLGVVLQDEAFIFWDARFSGPLDIASLVEYHKQMRGEVTAGILHSGSSPVNISGQLYGSKLVEVGDKGLPVAGVFVAEPGLLSGGYQTLYKDALSDLAKEGKLCGFVFSPEKAPIEQKQVETATV